MDPDEKKILADAELRLKKKFLVERHHLCAHISDNVIERLPWTFVHDDKADKFVEEDKIAGAKKSRQDDPAEKPTPTKKAKA